MRKRPKQPKWIKAFKRKIRTSSYLEQRAYELFAERMGINEIGINNDSAL